jgi:hypothetical protein
MRRLVACVHSTYGGRRPGCDVRIAHGNRGTVLCRLSHNEGRINVLCCVQNAILCFSYSPRDILKIDYAVAIGQRSRSKSSVILYCISLTFGIVYTGIGLTFRAIRIRIGLSFRAISIFISYYKV